MAEPAGRGAGPAPRRQPVQPCARRTVAAVLDAVARVLRQGGPDAVTTNRIAEVAGVSIGSIYQYFPDKRAIFQALHDRHVEDIARVVETTRVAHAAAPLDDVLRALIEALVTAHTGDAELHQLLWLELPDPAGGAQDLASRLRGALRLAICARVPDVAPAELDRMLFVLPAMIDALAHGATLHRPPRLSLTAATDEAVRAVLGYVHGHPALARAAPARRRWGR